MMARKRDAGGHSVVGRPLGGADHNEGCFIHMNITMAIPSAFVGSL